MLAYNIYGISSCIKDNKSDCVVFRPKILGLQYILLLLLFTFFEDPKYVTFYVFLLCFTRFLEVCETYIRTPQKTSKLECSICPA